MNIIFNFNNKNNIQDILDITYKTLNDFYGKELIHFEKSDRIVWDVYYDDVFDVLTEEGFILKCRGDIHFILKNLGEFKKAEPENYKKFIEWVMDYQVEEIATNKYVNGKINFSYEIQSNNFISKIPMTIIPLIVIIIASIIFYFLPENADIISAQGDYYLGVMWSYLLFLCLGLDYLRFRKNR